MGLSVQSFYLAFYLAFSVLIVASFVGAQSNDEILSSYSRGYCKCGLGAVLRRVKDFDASPLKRITRCTECYVLAKIDEPSRKGFSVNSPKDSDAEEMFGQRLRELVNMYPGQLARLFSESLSKASRNGGRNWDWYDGCFISYALAATDSEPLGVSKDFAEVACQGEWGLPQALNISDTELGEYLAIIPLRNSGKNTAGARAVFRVNTKHGSLSSEALSIESYDPYTGQSANSALLGPSNGSVWSWDSASDSGNGLLSTHIRDSESSCGVFSSKYSLAPGSILRLERSVWRCSGTTAGSPDNCPVVVYDRDANLKGKLIKGRRGCEQPNAGPHPYPF